MTHKSDLIQIFSERGYIHQATDLDAIDACRHQHHPYLYWF